MGLARHRELVSCFGRAFCLSVTLFIWPLCYGSKMSQCVAKGSSNSTLIHTGDALMRFFTAVLFSTLVLAPVSALADDCQADVAKIDAAIAKGDLDSDIKAQAEDMRNQAVQLCGAGNVDEGMAVTADAKTLLKIE
jgi:hypothetical protein